MWKVKTTPVKVKCLLKQQLPQQLLLLFHFDDFGGLHNEGFIGSSQRDYATDTTLRRTCTDQHLPFDIEEPDYTGR